MIPLFWCVTCGLMTHDVIAASAHQFPPTNHPEMRKIGAMPMPMYLVKRGTVPFEGITTITDDKAYAEGFVAGLNHAGKRYWHRVEEIEPIPAGTLVRYWPGARDGDGQVSTIREGSTLRLVGGTPTQMVVGAGPIAMTHIETIQEAA